MSTSQHTQFLDLTNGEGGEKAQPPPAPPDEDRNYREDHHHLGQHNYQEVHTHHDQEDNVGGDDEDDGTGMDSHSQDHSTASADSPEGTKVRTVSTTTGGGGAVGGAMMTTSGISIDPSTPGRVVESGREQTGRWTKEEHEAFLSALQMYGKEWKKVAAKVKTRTVVQTRTHAQKYFQKLQKTMEQTGLDDITHVEMGISSAAKAKKVGVDGEQLQQQPCKKTRPRSGSSGSDGMMIPAVPSVASAAPAAMQPTSKPNRRTSSVTLQAAQVISGFSSHTPAGPGLGGGGGGGLPIVRHGFSMDTSVAPTAATATPAVDAEADAFPTPYSSSAGSRWLSSNGGGATSTSAMKIVAPDPYTSMKRSLPEPSPAATGKRKLAEIAAARMLAGVAGSSFAPPPAHPPPSIRTNFQSSDPAPPPVADEDGCPPTPPPSQAPSVTSSHPFEGAGSARLNLRDAPLPPLFSDSASTAEQQAGGQRKGLTLQIVNPESLGVTFEQRKRRRDGEQSPVTPWDGQLQALVESEENNKTGGNGVSGLASSSIPSLPSAAGISINTSGRSSLLGGTAMGSSSLHPVCGPGTSFRRSPLHKAICDVNVHEIEKHLEQIARHGNDEELRRVDDAGYCPLHTACAIRLAHPEKETSMGVVALLLQAGADVSQPDTKGNTPLHWAARAGDKDVAEKLLLKNCDFDARNKDSETPLHWAMRSGRRGVDVTTVLLSNGARPGVMNKDFRRPIDVAADGFLDEPNSLATLRLRDEQGQKVKKDLKKVLKESSGERKDARTNFLIRSAYSRTLVLHHPECLEHHPKSETDWETPDRVKSIMRRVLPSSDSTGATETSGVFPHEVTVSQEFDRAKLDLLSRVHSTEYLSFVNELSKDLEKQLKDSGVPVEDSTSASFGSPPVVPFTPMVQRSMIKIDDANIKCGLNSDTSFSVGSLKAARRAAGAVQHAVDCVLVGRNRNAFCVVRPPGHHAGINGLLEGGESCGFCIFNNVAAGALYAIADDKLLCNRCAIVDIDVHHGNGTEEIVRKCHDPSKLFFFSIHLYDNDKKKRGSTSQFQYKFYPGTGNEDDLALNIINVPIVPLWKEAPPPPLTNKTHNTRQKTRATKEETQSQDESSETGTPRENGSRNSDGGSEIGSTPHAMQSPAPTSGSSGRMAYRQAIQSRLLPSLRAFDPDLIIISAGFDACKGDVGNARHERGRERMGLDLEPEDYAWTTRKILEIADICCQGRVVSVLEGGYGRTPLAQGQQPKGLDRTVFAECAIRHLHAMIDPYNTEKRFSL